MFGNAIIVFMLFLEQGHQQQRKIGTSIIVSMLFLEQGQQQQRKIETSPRIIVSILFLEQRQHQQQQRKIGTSIFCFQCYSWRRDNTNSNYAILGASTNSNNVRSGQVSFVSSATPGERTTLTATT
ncbi:LOW QUALITY PROTEIN: hypothetical protein PoB_007378100 [Plakobranchus ocellatus]|uniref:Secreted protein n=1 Tax=Plakobranchus ocellatus TaxID=259542 RepID=A0AAV4DTQ7_9GAST|nr:LOW QUALITY PROTEIN: hypothetical protein PoB_007378100 [Plakobranchus ocellatus]